MKKQSYTKQHLASGFPSPADDFMDTSLDLNEFLIRQPEASYMVEASGESMTDAGIYAGDVMIVDRSITPGNNMIVIAALDGDLMVKRLKQFNGDWLLISENPAYGHIKLQGEQSCVVWGVVTYVIHKMAA